jgi:hypothetical protein
MQGRREQDLLTHTRIRWCVREQAAQLLTFTRSPTTPQGALACQVALGDMSGIDGDMSSRVVLLSWLNLDLPPERVDHFQKLMGALLERFPSTAVYPLMRFAAHPSKEVRRFALHALPSLIQGLTVASPSWWQLQNTVCEQLNDEDEAVHVEAVKCAANCFMDRMLYPLLRAAENVSGSRWREAYDTIQYELIHQEVELWSQQTEQAVGDEVIWRLNWLDMYGDTLHKGCVVSPSDRSTYRTALAHPNARLADHAAAALIRADQDALFAIAALLGSPHRGLRRRGAAWLLGAGPRGVALLRAHVEATPFSGSLDAWLALCPHAPPTGWAQRAQTSAPTPALARLLHLASEGNQEAQDAGDYISVALQDSERAPKRVLEALNLWRAAPGDASDVRAVFARALASGSE